MERRKIETVRVELPERTPEQARRVRDHVAMKALRPNLKLSELNEEEKVLLSLLPAVGDGTGFDRLLQLRRAAYKEHVSGMTVPDDLKMFADVMERSFGPQVQIWRQRLGWLEALMVARYGEEPSVWPETFNEEDSARAADWLIRNRWPNGASRLLDTNTLQILAKGAARLGVWLLMAVAVAAALLVDWRFSLVVPFVIGTALSDYSENRYIDHNFRARAHTAPADQHIALFTAAPGDAGGGTEVTGGSYARVQFANGFANWLGTGGETTNVDSSGTSGQTSNRNPITFPTPSAAWGQCTHMGSYDASTSGNLLWYVGLTTPKTVNNGDPAPSFAASALTFTIG